MAEPWIRVHANLAAKPIVWRAMEALGVRRPEAIGLLVAFWGEVSQHAPNGLVTHLPAAQLEAWAGWRGKRGRFAAFILAQHVDRDGRVNEWDDYAGALEEQRRQSRDRKRKSRGRHSDSTCDNAVTSSPTIRNETRREEVVVENAGRPIDGMALGEPALTSLYLTIWANGAITERWGESANPFTQAMSCDLADRLFGIGVEWQIARASIYAQCREAKRSDPPGHPNYFRPGIEKAWAEEIARRQLAASGEVPPEVPDARDRPATDRGARPSKAPSGTGHATLVLREIKKLAVVVRQPGQAESTYIPKTAVAGLGADVLEAYEAVGGAERVLGAHGDQVSFLIRDFTSALEAASHAHV